MSFRELFRLAIGAGTGLLYRVALPGVHDKISGRMIAFPVAGTPGQYLLKLEPPELPHLVEKEAFFLADETAHSLAFRRCSPGTRTAPVARISSQVSVTDAV